NLEYYHFLETTIDGIPVIVTRTGWSAEVGYEIYLCDGSRGTDLWNRVMAAGKPFDLRPTGPSEYRRIEAGILNYPSDIDWNHNPYEAGLGWLVDLDKEHDFIGRAGLRKIKKEGPKKKLVGVEVPGDEVVRPWLPHPWPVRKDGKEVGTLTALAMSPRLQKNMIRLVADSIDEAWYRNRNRDAGRFAEGDRRQEAIHRSEEGNAEVLIPHWMPD